MKVNDELSIAYGYDFREIGSEPLHGWCVHLICLAGEGSFVVDERLFHVGEGDIIVVSFTEKLRNITAAPSMQVEYMAAPNRILSALLPANNYGIGGGIALFDNPVMHVSQPDGKRFLDDIRRIRERMDDEPHAFQRELIQSLCLTMIYDLFGFHARLMSQTVSTDRTSFVVRGFLQLLQGGASQSHRDVGYYARELNVSVKYLENTVRRQTGQSVMSFIDRYTVPMIVELLKQDGLSFSQIAERMNFASLSYFSRYVTKHLGMSPTQYRQTQSPKK